MKKKNVLTVIIIVFCMQMIFAQIVPQQSTNPKRTVVFADTTKEIFILVNKNYYLSKNYIPADLIKMTEKYGDSTRMMKKEAYKAYIRMHDDAKIDGVNLWITSAYRTYEYQKWLYEISMSFLAKTHQAK